MEYRNTKLRKPGQHGPGFGEATKFASNKMGTDGGTSLGMIENREGSTGEVASIVSWSKKLCETFFMIKGVPNFGAFSVSQVRVNC